MVEVIFPYKNGRLSLLMVNRKGRNKKENKKEKEKEKKENKSGWLFSLISQCQTVRLGWILPNCPKLLFLMANTINYHCTIHINTSWHEPTYMSDHCFALASVTSSYWHLRLEWIHQQVKADDASVSAVIDTLKNSMQSLIFGKNGFNSIQHWFTAKNGPFF